MNTVDRFKQVEALYHEARERPAAERSSRVLAQPAIGKAEISAKLCTQAGLAIAKVSRRDKAAYAEARHWRWGDAVNGKS